MVYLGEAETSQAMGNTADDYLSLLSVPGDPLGHNAMYSYGMSDEFHWLATGGQGIATPGGGSGSAGGGRTGGDGAENGIQSSNGSISNSVNESAVGDKEIVKEKDLKTKEGKDYPYVEQETPDYCVPANLQAANEFYDVDRNKSQKQMMLEGDKQIKTPWVDDLKYFLNMNGYSTFGEYLSLEGIINSIDQNIPVLVGVNKSPNSLGDFHLVTITGYSIYNNGSFELRIMNPDPSHTLKVINDLNQIKIRSFINLKRKNY